MILETSSAQVIDRSLLADPYLCANFYVTGSVALPIATQLATRLNLSNRTIIRGAIKNLEAEWESDSVPDRIDWARIRLYQIPGEHQPLEQAKVTLIQLLQATEGPAVANWWGIFRQRLLAFDDILFTVVVTPAGASSLQSSFLGYSLVYGSTLQKALPSINNCIYELQFNEQEAVRGFDFNQTEVIRQAILDHDNLAPPTTLILSLSAVPIETNLRSGLIYWLAHQEENQFEKWCESPNGLLNQIDILAHKTFAQRSDFLRFRPIIDLLLEKIMINNSSLANSLNDPSNAFKLIDQYENEIIPILGIFPWSAAVNISIRQQLTNINIIRSQQQDNTVFELIAKLVQNDEESIRLYVAKLKAISDSTQTAFNFHKIKQSKKDEAHQQTIQYLLTFFGLCLAVLQVYDNEGATELIRSWLNCSDYAPSYIDKILVRTGISIAIPLLIIVLFMLFNSSFRSLRK